MNRRDLLTKIPAALAATGVEATADVITAEPKSLLLVVKVPRSMFCEPEARAQIRASLRAALGDNGPPFVVIRNDMDIYAVPGSGLVTLPKDIVVDLPEAKSHG